MTNQLSTAEAVLAGAQSLKAYGRIFFPKTYRQDSPVFHEEIGAALYAPGRHVAVEVFRGGAKTTLLRVFTSQRIAYAISRTIMYVSETQDHSIRSIRWIKRQIDHNRVWAQTFGLKRGSKWTDEVIEIENTIDNIFITIVAVGITGQLRGVNIDDYRPDLIIVDDPCNEENTNTDEQRKKINGLFFGALERSLAPAVDSPNAKMVLLQTPLNAEDVIAQCKKSATWRVLTFGVFNDAGQSRWEERFPLEQLLRDKKDYIARNQLPLWTREMECRLIKSARTAFDLKWLKYWDVLPDNLLSVVAIDPASSEEAEADQQAAVVVAKVRGKRQFYLLEYTIERGEMPDALAHTVIDYIKRWNPRGMGVETVAYQKVLAWYMKEAMKAARVYTVVHEMRDRRKKSDRIIQSFTAHGLAPYGNFYIRDTHLDFISQFGEYGPDVEMHEDLLDAVSMAIQLLYTLDGDTEGEGTDDTRDELSEEDLLDRYGLPRPREEAYSTSLSGCP